MATYSPENLQPRTGKRNVLITSALPYVNNVPHLGNIIGCVLSADVFARYDPPPFPKVIERFVWATCDASRLRRSNSYCRQRGYNTLYICGTDEYGTATETRAVQEGLTPQQICDKYHAIHKEVYDWFGVDFDHFGRTTTQHQTRVAQDIFLRIYRNNYVVEDEMEQLFCERDARYLADRFVYGECPKCNFDDARGDQCDKCGNLTNATDLINPKCKLCNSSPTIKKTRHLFLDLPMLQDRLSDWVNETSHAWSPNSVGVTKAWLVPGNLKPRCITRDLQWGTPVPLEAFKNKVFYVWFDAPIGYISITADYTPHWEKWWKKQPSQAAASSPSPSETNGNNSEVELIQFMGKDNVPFHTIIFPASLLATGEDWNLVKKLSTTEYLNYEGGKFSKSRNTGVFGDQASKTEISASVWRYYLLSGRPEAADSDFTWKELQNRNNADLADTFGNFVNRGLVFAQKFFNNKVPAVINPTERDYKLVADVNAELKDYEKAMEDCRIRDAIRIALCISRLGNVYLQETKYWELQKTNLVACGTVVATAISLSRLLATIFWPFIPSACNDVLYKQIKLVKEVTASGKDAPTFLGEFKLDLVPSGHTLGETKILFPKIKDDVIEKYKKQFSGAQNKRA